ncbi:MAG: hypothetical protein KTQ49_08240 [Candidatus Omnitrophica bacterium]|nr:hypothetical protein [Candidatus Omnitrophota bacterium]
MAAKSILLLGGFLLLTVPTCWCEVTPEATDDIVNTATPEENVRAAIPEDPYGDITWDSVTKKAKPQEQTITVFDPDTRTPDFVTVSSTGDTPANVDVVVPVKQRSKRWFFW